MRAGGSLAARSWAARGGVLALVLAAMLGAPAPSYATWRTYPLGSARSSYPVVNVSCPTTRLCVGIDRYARIVSSTDPAGPPRAWKRSNRIEPLPSGVYVGPISCSRGADSVCVTIDSAENVLASTDPTGGAGAWTITNIAPFDGHDVACAASSLCVVADGGDRIAISTTPAAAGGGGWQVVALGQGLKLSTIACPSVSLCVALDGTDGHVVSSTDPAGGAGTWKVAPLPRGYFGSFYSLVGVSCPTTHFCAAVDKQSGQLLTSTDPAGGASAWRLTSITGTPLESADFNVFECASSRLCLAASRYQDLYTSIDPIAGPRAWIETLLKQENVNPRLPGSYGPTNISCPSARLCLVSQDDSSVQISTRPAALAQSAARPAFSRATLKGIARGKPALAFALRAGIILPGRAISSIAVRLPPGLAYATRASVRAGVTVTGPHNARLRYSLRLSAGKLTLTLARPVARVRVTIGSSALRASQALAQLVARGRVKSLTLSVRTVDAGKASVTQKLKVKVL